MPIIVLGEKLYSLKETAAMLEITPRTMQDYISKDRIQGQKIGGAWRFTEKAIKDFIAGRQPSAKKTG